MVSKIVIVVIVHLISVYVKQASLRSGTVHLFYVCYFYASCSEVLFLSFTFGFVHQLQTAENTTLLVMGNIFHSGLDGRMILYTLPACFVTYIEIK